MPTRRAVLLLGSQVLFALGITSLNAWLYGGPTKTGYSSGEITFSLGAIHGNIHVMPKPLLEAMPVIVVALAAVIWIVAKFVATRGDGVAHRTATRDLAVAAGLVAIWLGVFGLYFFYNWTADMGGGSVGGAIGSMGGSFHLPSGTHLPSSVHLPTGTHAFGGGGGGMAGGGGIVHVVRFYVPAIGPMALLAAWFLTRLKRRSISVAIVVVAFLLGFWGFSTMSASGAAGGIGGGFPGAAGAVGGSSTHGGSAGGPAGFGSGIVGNGASGSGHVALHCTLPSGTAQPSGGFPGGGTPPSGGHGSFPGGGTPPSGVGGGAPPSASHGGFPGGITCTPVHSGHHGTTSTTTSTTTMG
jgi:hypothetical protein